MTSDPLAQLRDIHLPPEISWWPPAPGWYVVAGVLILLLVLLSYRLWQAYQRRCVVRAILAQVTELSHLPSDQALKQLATLLRCLALTYYPREQVAGLHGNAWLTFLDETGKTNEFSKGIGRVLLTAPYEAHSDADKAALIELITRWVKAQKGRHHVNA